MTLPELFQAAQKASDAMKTAELTYQQARTESERAHAALYAALQGIRTAMEAVQSLPVSVSPLPVTLP